MKKILAALMATTVTVSLAACGGDGVTNSNSSSGDSKTENSPSTESTTAADSGSGAPEAPSGQLVIGSITDLNADMMDGFSSGASNMNVYNILYDTSPISYHDDTTFGENPSVLEDYKSVANEDGSKTITVKIKNDLKFSDGSAITAKDYVFSNLLFSSKEFGEIDGQNTGGTDFVGYEDFSTGKTRTFSGVRLLDDYTFSVTIAAENLPFFYENTYVVGSPLPMSVIAPDVTITDDGNGATISDNFTTELLQKTINDSETGYRYKPMVTCGPYKFVSFDQASLQAVFEVNEHYAGNYLGEKPKIQKIVMKSVTDKTAIDELSKGQVDLLSTMSGGDTINAGMDLVDQGKVSYNSYARPGFGLIRFACNFGPTQSAAVRQAIAYSIDRDEFARQYTQGYGLVVDANYSPSQGEYTANKDALEKDLIHYSLDSDKAKQLLIDDGWTLNKDGGEFVEGTDEYRCKKMEDGTLMEGVIQWANTANNPVADLIAASLPANLQKIGLKLEATTMDFGKLQEEIKQKNGQTYHMFNMGTGFAKINSPWYYYNMDLEAWGGLYNNSWIVDEQLSGIAEEMKKLEPGDQDSWNAKWLELQVRWNQLMPEIPLYCDEYHDFYNSKLKNFKTNGLWDWPYAIVSAYVEE